MLTRLKHSRALFIPTFNADAQGENGSHWRLAVLNKPSATLRVYDSMHNSSKFNGIAPHLTVLSNGFLSPYAH